MDQRCPDPDIPVLATQVATSVSGPATVLAGTGTAVSLLLSMASDIHAVPALLGIMGVVGILAVVANQTRRLADIGTSHCSASLVTVAALTLAVLFTLLAAVVGVRGLSPDAPAHIGSGARTLAATACAAAGCGWGYAALMLVRAGGGRRR